MPENTPAPARPRFGVNTIVGHPHFGCGKIVAFEKEGYVVMFKGGEVRHVAFTFDGLKAEEGTGDPESDRIKQAMREVLGDYGWLDIDLELGKRWIGGTLKLVPGKQDTQPRDVPIEAFFKKIIGIRDRLRVLEQKVNAHPSLAPEEKLELQGYITRCYGSLTTFNALFAAKESQFQGTGKEE
jgi:hypothetical protein